MKAHFTETVTNFYEDSHFIQEALAKIDWEVWIHGKGAAPVVVDFYNRDIQYAHDLCDAYIFLGGNESPPSYQKFFSFYTIYNSN
jgi:hypothetical protein